jgi:hypothetical protein
LSAVLEELSGVHGAPSAVPRRHREGRGPLAGDRERLGEAAEGLLKGRRLRDAKAFAEGDAGEDSEPREEGTRRVPRDRHDGSPLPIAFGNRPTDSYPN